MKKLLFLLLFIPLVSFGQKIIKNEVDEFTNNAVKITSWVKVVMNSNINAYVKSRKINKNYFLDFKMILDDKAYSIDKGEVLYLKLSNDKILKLVNLSYELVSVGGGSVGISGSNLLGIGFTCEISEEILNILIETPIVKLRVYTSEGYKEEIVKQKRAKKFIKMLEIIK